MKNLHVELKFTWTRVYILAAVGVVALVYFLAPMFFPEPAIQVTQQDVPTGCTDTDGGLLPGVKGVCKDEHQYTDNCLTAHVLAEYACDQGLCIRRSLNCDTIGTKCTDGICVPKEEVPVVELPNESTTSVQLPDLVISSINHYVTNVSGDNGTRNLTVFLEVALENRGNRPSPASLLNISLTGPLDIFDALDAPLVYDGKLIIVPVSFVVQNVTGTYTAEAFADILQAVKEADENNNVFSVSFDVE